MPHPLVYKNINDDAKSSQELKIKDCWSCRIYGTLFHLGVAGFVASHYKNMPSKSAKSFIVIFSSGVGYLGLARLFNLYPFPTITKQTTTNN